MHLPIHEKALKSLTWDICSLCIVVIFYQGYCMPNCMYFLAIIYKLASSQCLQSSSLTATEQLSPELHSFLLIKYIFFYLKKILLFFFLPHCVACEILVPQPGIEPGLLHWKCRVLTTGLPGPYNPFLRRSLNKT